MNTTLKWSLIGVASVVGISFATIGSIFVSLGGFETVEGTYAGSCKRIVGMPGAEDIEPDYSTGFAYVSSEDRWSYAAGNNVPGAIYRIDMNAEGDVQPIKMTGTENLENFHPHGISFYPDGERKLLFVISHRVPEAPLAGHDIYSFEIEDSSLTLLEKFTDPGFRSPNDLAAVGARQFYFSNDRGALDEGGSLVEIMLGLEASDISYFDGNASSVVVDGLAFANGVAVSRDRATVYASAFRGGVTNVYGRDTAMNSLTLQRSFETGTGPDNIVLAEDGSIWVAAHVNNLSAIAHAGDPTTLAPVRVFKIGSDETPEIVYEDDGGLISAASVAVPYKGKLFIGAIFQDWVLSCKM